MLSRLPTIAAVCTISFHEPFTKDEYVEDYKHNKDFREMFMQEKQDEVENFASTIDFQLKDGLLFKLGKLSSLIRRLFLREAHTSKVAGHFGVNKTISNLQRYVC